MKDDKDEIKQIETFYELGVEYLSCDYIKEAKEETQKFDIKEIEHSSEVSLIKNIDECNALGILGFVKNHQIDVFHGLDSIASYIAGKFVFQTEDKDFAVQLSDVGFELIKGGYFQSIYVVYSEEIKEQERKIGEKYYGQGQGRSGGEPKNCPRSNIRIFTRESEGTFRSILSNVSRIKLPEERLVCFSSSYTRYFREALKLILNYMNGMHGYYTACKASSKRYICDVKNIAAFNSEIESIYETGSPIIERKSQVGQENTYQEMVPFPVEEVITVLKNVLAGFDESAKGIGIQGKNLGEKKERVTVGENEIDTDFTSTIQMFLLQRLKAPFEYFKKLNPGVPEDLEVAIYVKKVTNEMQEERNEEVETNEEDKIVNGDNG